MGVRPAGQPDRSEFTGDELEKYDWVVQRERNRGDADEKDRINDYYGTLLRSPELCFHISSLGRWARLVGERGDSYSHADREWVDQVLSWEMRSTTVLAGHLEDALCRGVRIEAIKALREGNEELFSPGERLVAEYVRQVYHGRVSDETYAAVEERMGVRGAVEFTGWILFLHLTIRLIEAVTGGAGPDDETLMARIKAFADGSIPLPTELTYEAG
ncbi:hypothetical protein [Streptomyces sp. NPDC057199]|uniref:hypothetical protein n=1 Tax=Streptomyces sp. NPDC057199 TaxID=3346047 RepID=UPI003628CB1B